MSLNLDWRNIGDQDNITRHFNYMTTEHYTKYWLPFRDKLIYMYGSLEKIPHTVYATAYYKFRDQYEQETKEREVQTSQEGTQTQEIQKAIKRK